MPHHHSRSSVSDAALLGSTNYGQVIEYIQDRLYLASYTHAPTSQTPFPYPAKSHNRSPSKRSSKAQNGPTAADTSKPELPPVYFSVDKSLLYNAFHHDFGPLHIGHLYRFAVHLHEVLADNNNEDRRVVFWTHADSRCRANAACLLACYMVLIQNWPPHLALAPIAQMDPPPMPFRDAGYSQSDYTMTIQDVVYGVWRAKEENLCGLKDFNLEEYEKYERVDMGDFNWVSPDFLAFASPQHQPTDVIPSTSPLYAQIPTTLKALENDTLLPTPFRNVLHHFKSRNIGLVVRLNSALYSPSYFTALGIAHLDMVFDDGTCPPLRMTRRWINLAHQTITQRKQAIAVHCKAGLGRTGCLIGAYLIYRHGFTANECIAYMRFMRPGMVVGPQQHWLHLNQMTFREWRWEDTCREKLEAQIRAEQPSTPVRNSAARPRSTRMNSTGPTCTPPNGSQSRRVLGEIGQNSTSHSQSTITDTASSFNDVHDENLPAPTPGQPRKYSKSYAARTPRHASIHEDPPSAEIVQMQRVSQSGPSDGESEEEWQLRLLSRSSRSPSSKLSSSAKRRAVSYTTTTTTVEKIDVLPSSSAHNSDDENTNPATSVASSFATEKGSAVKTPTAKRSGSGMGSMSVSKTRSGHVTGSPKRSSLEQKAGVRKASGPGAAARVGSVSVLNGAAGVRFKQ